MSIFEPDQKLGRVKGQENEFEWQEVGKNLVRDRSNLAWFFVVLVMAMMVLTTRLVFLQVTHAASNQLLAQGNRIRKIELLPSRGIITDRFNVPLSKNLPSFSLELVPANLPVAVADRERIISRLKEINLLSEIQEEKLRSDYNSPQSIALVEHLDHDKALEYKVDFQDDPGLQIVDRPRRDYLRVPGLSHLLGYTGKVGEEEIQDSSLYTYSSTVGRAGLEQVYEPDLQGKLGYEQVEVDAKGFFQRQVGLKEPIAGQTLKLSLDLELQKKAAEALKAKIEETESKSGVVIVENPQNGEILAMVSLPDYDNNEFTSGITPEQVESLFNHPDAVLTNRAIAGVYPSGSVIKPFIAVAGLAEGVITESTTIDAPAQITIGDFVFPDLKRHGLTDVKKALAVSSNVFFYAVGGGWDKIPGLGVQKIDDYLGLFGFGEKTGIDLDGELSGLVPTPAWKARVKQEAWFTGDTYHLSIGQGDLLVTPLQIVNATSAIANGGRLSTPTLVLGNKAEPISTELTQYTDSIDIVRAGMRQAVLDGSARRLQDLPVSSAAKTGTAQFGADDKTHAWFSAFAPYENPEFAVVVLIDGGGAGNEVALPVAEEIMDWYFSR
ncbi:penicillin-binding protein 2 [Candidatus Berkelbacteria bacterium]|nr:penicillin-binding protein 2 [Candidatus Berkelbacteria bacterium]